MISWMMQRKRVTGNCAIWGQCLVHVVHKFTLTQLLFTIPPSHSLTPSPSFPPTSLTPSIFLHPGIQPMTQCGQYWLWVVPSPLPPPPPPLSPSTSWQGSTLSHRPRLGTFEDRIALQSSLGNGELSTCDLGTCRICTVYMYNMIVHVCIHGHVHVHCTYMHVMCTNCL